MVHSPFNTIIIMNVITIRAGCGCGLKSDTNLQWELEEKIRQKVIWIRICY